MKRVELASSQLKIVALLLMTVEHITDFLPRLFPPLLHTLGLIIGRSASPLFIFLSVESYFHTKSKEKYLLRMAMFSVIMLLGNTVMYRLFGGSIFPNVFQSMFLGLLLLFIIDKIRGTSISLAFPYGVLVPFILAGSWLSEGTIIVPLLYVLFYLFRENRLAASVGMFSIVLLLIGFAKFAGFPFWGTFIEQWAMIGAVPFILVYNGQKGRELKLLFYLYYPLHVWLLMAVGAIFLLR